MTPQFGLVALACASVLACASRAAPQASLSSLEGDVARVGDVSIRAALVAYVADANGTSPRVALEGLIEDTVAAQEARARHLDEEPTAAWASAVTIARSVAERSYAEARAEGAPRDDEIESAEVVHALVARSSLLSEERASATAVAIAQAVLGAGTADEFARRAQAVPHPGSRVVVERIGPFTADGRTPDGAQLDATFVAAALALRAPSETSPVVETPFGWHVIQLVRREAPDTSSLESRRNELAGAVVAVRARWRCDAALRARKERTRVEVASPAEALMAEAAARLQ
jgi:hypothetical protein